jgi:hypothetical protein
MRGLDAFVVVASAALVGPGCMSYRPVPPLDDDERAELESLAPRLASERVRLVAAERGRTPAEWSDGNMASERASGDDVDDFRAAVALAGAVEVDTSPTVVVEVRPPWRTFGEPLINVLTLGFVPDVSSDRFEYQWRLVAEDGRDTAGELDTESPSWTGWLVGPIALLPGWRLSATWKKDEQRNEVHSDARRSRIALALAKSVVRLREAAAR